MGDVLFMEISMACYDCIPLRIPNILFTPFTHPANFLVFNIPPPESTYTYTHTPCQGALDVQKYESIQWTYVHSNHFSYLRGFIGKHCIFLSVSPFKLHRLQHQVTIDSFKDVPLLRSQMTIKSKWFISILTQIVALWAGHLREEFYHNPMIWLGLDQPKKKLPFS